MNKTNEYINIGSAFLNDVYASRGVVVRPPLPFKQRF